MPACATLNHPAGKRFWLAKQMVWPRYQLRVLPLDPVTGRGSVHRNQTSRRSALTGRLVRENSGGLAETAMSAHLAAVKEVDM